MLAVQSAEFYEQRALSRKCTPLEACSPTTALLGGVFH